MSYNEKKFVRGVENEDYNIKSNSNYGYTTSSGKGL